MGNWNISIRGVGAHHNKFNATDADRMAAKFVAELKAAGHSVVAASIVCGMENELMVPDVYLANRDASDKQESRDSVIETETLKVLRSHESIAASGLYERVSRTGVPPFSLDEVMRVVERLSARGLVEHVEHAQGVGWRATSQEDRRGS